MRIDATWYVQHSRRIRLAALLSAAAATVLFSGCSDDGSDSGVPDDYVETVHVYGEFTIAESLYDAGAITLREARQAAKAVGLSQADQELLFGGTEKAFPSISQVIEEQRMRDFVVYLVRRSSNVEEHRELYHELCQRLFED